MKRKIQKSDNGRYLKNISRARIYIKQTIENFETCIKLGSTKLTQSMAMTFTQYYYYALSNPTTGKIGYVGITQDRRLEHVVRKHIEEAMRALNSVETEPIRWIKEQLQTERGLYIDQLESTAFSTGQEAEVRLAYWRDKILGQTIEANEDNEEQVIEDEALTSLTAEASQNPWIVELAMMREQGATWKEVQERSGLTRREFDKLKKQIEEILS